MCLSVWLIDDGRIVWLAVDRQTPPTNCGGRPSCWAGCFILCARPASGGRCIQEQLHDISHVWVVVLLPAASGGCVWSSCLAGCRTDRVISHSSAGWLTPPSNGGRSVSLVRLLVPGFASHVDGVGMAGSHVCVCAPVKPTRGYYVTTRGCATDYVCVTPSIPHFIVGLSLLSCVLDS